MIQFDTNFLIQALVSGTQEESRMKGWLAGSDRLMISAVAWAEFLSGPLQASAESLARRIFPDPEPLIGIDAEKAAELFNQTGRRSRSLPDCMIAATAIRLGAALATSNVGDFGRFRTFGLILA
jgi:predicted nucleic acid-binding protein